MSSQAVAEILAMNLAERLTDGDGPVTPAMLRERLGEAYDAARLDTVKDTISVQKTGEKQVTISIPADLFKL